MPSEDIVEFSKFFNELYDVIFNYAIIITAVGTLSMAFVDAFKGLFRLKGLFLKYKIKKWISNHNSTNRDKAIDELLCLAAGDHECNIPWDWWDQPEEQFFPRIHSAAETALDFPVAYPNLYNVLTHELTGKDEWGNNASIFRSEVNQASDQCRIDNLAGVRARIGNAVSRRLDTLQMQVEWYWTKMNQLTAIIISIMIFIAFSFKYPIGCVTAIGTGIVAGLLAPLAKDLVSRISGIKLQNRF